MAFDPDAFLARVSPAPSSGPFDPDAFLKRAGQGAPAPAEPQREKPGLLEAGSRGFLQGVTFGYGDEIGGLLTSAFTKKTYREARDEIRTNDKAAKEAHPWGYGLAEILGGVAVPGVGAAKGVGSAVKAGAALGAAGALGTSEADLTEGDFAGAIKDTATGAAVGGATAGALHKILGKYVDNAVERRAKHLTEDIGEGAIPTVKRRLGKVTEVNERTEQSLAVNVLDGDKEFTKALKRGQKEAREVAKERLETLGKEVTPYYKALDRETGGIPLGHVAERLEAAVAEADVAGNAHIHRALEEARDQFIGVYRRRLDIEPGKDLNEVMIPTQDVRQWVTRLKGQATTSMGSLSETERKVVKDQVHRAADKILGEHLDGVARSIPEMAPTVEALKEANRRILVYASAENALGGAIERKNWSPQSLSQKLSETGLPIAAGLMGAGADLVSGGVAFAGTKAALAAGKKLNREATRALATLVRQARAGSVTAAEREAAIRSGVPLMTVYAVASRVGGGAPAEEE